jgi:hypothetical protein
VVGGELLALLADYPVRAAEQGLPEAPSMSALDIYRMSAARDVQRAVASTVRASVEEILDRCRRQTPPALVDQVEQCPSGALGYELPKAARKTAALIRGKMPASRAGQKW